MNYVYIIIIIYTELNGIYCNYKYNVQNDRNLRYIDLQSRVNARSNIFAFSTSSAEDEEEEVCYKHVGCFPINYPYYIFLNRPVPSPQSPKIIGTNFIFYSRENEYATKIKAKPFEKLPGIFNRNLGTVYIIHGFLSAYNQEYIQELKDAILDALDVNVVMVDWSFSSNLSYLECVSNIRVIGKQTALLAQNLDRFGGKKDHWCIGHSLGAHACGYMGENYQTLHRITGLDPAGPEFDMTNIKVHLDMKDANFVDVHHTDISLLGFGIRQEIGHVDFYYNGAKQQPGCSIFRPNIFNTKNDNFNIVHRIYDKVSSKLACSHQYAVKFFSEAVRNNGNCTMWGKSADYENQVGCQLETCSPVGLRTFEFPYRGTMDITTNRDGQYPHCISVPKNDEMMENLLNSSSGVAEGIQTRMALMLQKTRRVMEKEDEHKMLNQKQSSFRRTLMDNIAKHNETANNQY